MYSLQNGDTRSTVPTSVCIIRGLKILEQGHSGPLGEIKEREGCNMESVHQGFIPATVLVSGGWD